MSITDEDVLVKATNANDPGADPLKLGPELLFSINRVLSRAMTCRDVADVARICLESEPDEGTTFFFTLPKAISPSERIVEEVVTG